eukprot:scaffold55065_cov17-Tisochrysis_lutea.AAC.1
MVLFAKPALLAKADAKARPARLVLGCCCYGSACLSRQGMVLLAKPALLAKAGAVAWPVPFLASCSLRR